MSNDPKPMSPAAMRDALAEIDLRLQELTEEILSLRNQMSRNDKERARLLTEKKVLEERLDTEKDPVTVSDHAVIRYLERRYGFDFEDVRAEILTPVVRSAVKAGAAGVKVNGGTFKIKGRTIITYFMGSEGRKR